MATTAELLNGIIESKQAIVNAIKAKGASVPDGAKLGDLASLLSSIEDGVPWGLDRISVETITIPDGVAKVGSAACSGWSKATTAYLPATGCTEIGVNAFINCGSLQWVNLHNTQVKIVGDSAFSNCRGLLSIIIPESVETIGSGAFYQCSSLSTVTIRSVAVEIGAAAFSGVPGSVSFSFTGKTPDQVKAMANYPWGLANGTVITCGDASDGTVETFVVGE